MAAWSEVELAQLLDRHAAGLGLYARQWTTDVDDVVQEAFVALVQLPSRPERPGPWLFGTVRRLALMAARRDRRRSRHETARARANEAWFTTSADDQPDSVTATAALADLPEPERETIILHLWGRLTFEELARVLDCSPATAHRRYTAALAQLRDRLLGTVHETNRSGSDLMKAAKGMG